MHGTTIRREMCTFLLPSARFRTLGSAVHVMLAANAGADVFASVRKMMLAVIALAAIAGPTEIAAQAMAPAEAVLRLKCGGCHAPLPNGRLARISEQRKAPEGWYMTLGVLKNVDSTKAGLITSRRVGGAVVRNRVRRRLRELLRLTRPQWCLNVWVVVIARHAAVDASFEELTQEWIRLAKRAGIIREVNP